MRHSLSYFIQWALLSIQIFDKAGYKSWYSLQISRCQCGHCVTMPTSHESICYCEMERVIVKKEEGIRKISCITLRKGSSVPERVDTTRSILQLPTSLWWCWREDINEQVTHHCMLFMSRWPIAVRYSFNHLNEPFLCIDNTASLYIDSWLCVVLECKRRRERHAEVKINTQTFNSVQIISSNDLDVRSCASKSEGSVFAILQGTCTYHHWQWMARRKRRWNVRRCWGTNISHKVPVDLKGQPFQFR